MDWWTWPLWRTPLWTVVGTIAQVISLIVVVFAVREVLSRRRHFPAVIWDVNTTKNRTDDDGKVLDYLVEIVNSGRHVAMIAMVIFVNANVVATHPNPQLKWVIRPGKRTKVWITTDDVDIAWVVVVSASHDNRFLFRGVWRPLTKADSAVGREQASFGRTPRDHLLTRHYRRRHPRPIGPVGDLTCTWLMKGRESATTSRTMQAMSVVNEQTPREVWLPGRVMRYPTPGTDSAGETALVPPVG